MSARELLADVERADAAAYAAIAKLDLPALDAAMSRLSRAADYSKLSIASGALLAALRGERGRRAALEGFVSVGAFAFATGVARVEPGAGVPLRVLAAAVAYSRIHTGVHFPGDVIAGALTGIAVARLTGWARRRR